jgi:hypothetical protein
MLDFLESRWHISLGSREKVKFLNLEFLEPKVAAMPAPEPALQAYEPAHETS